MATSPNVSIIGIGRLGICVALCLEKAGFNVLGVDVSPTYVAAVNNKTFKSTEPRVEELLHNSKNFRASTSIDEAVEFSDTIMIFVATPSTGGERHYDHSTVNRILTELVSQRIV
jgi:UDPglucose 6-dehydrogenase